MRVYLLVIAMLFVSCAIEDPSVAEFELQKIRLNGDAPFKSSFVESEFGADKQANLYYAMSNGDTIKVSVCEFETTTLAKAFFYNSDSIAEKVEILIDSERKRFLRHGRRLFIFSYELPISEHSATLDSIVRFTKRFPANPKANEDLCSFSLKNSRADEDFSMQRGYFLGVEAPFIMQVRRYRDENFTWACACSASEVSEKDWESYVAKRQNNIYGSDSTALISRLSSGIVVAVYGDLNKKQMRKVFNEFTRQVK